jgi:glycosyltransferase involved in cell wall biosynthesis
MSVGLPAVGAAAMGAYDVLKDGRGGITVPAAIESFTDAAYSLLTDPLLYKEKQRTALEKAKEWSAQKMTKRLISIYQETIQEYRDRRKHLR